MIGLARILKELEISGIDTIHIRQDGFESTSTFVGNGMLFVSEPSDEVIHAYVVRILNDVMHDALVGASFGVEEDGARFVGEGSEHETVCGFVAELTQIRMH